MRKVKSLICFLNIFLSIIFLLETNVYASDLKYSTETNLFKGEIDETADSNTAKNDGKIIILDISRTSLENLENIKYLREKLKENGFIGLMNVRGDKGYDERRNYASINATGRVNINSEENLRFETLNNKNKKLYKAATNQEPKSINLININSLDIYNQMEGQYKSKIGPIGDILSENDKKITALGNSDYFDDKYTKVENRDYCLSIMDSKGRIESGEIENINKEDDNFPFGISTDYEILKEKTKKSYYDSDLIFVNLGDTYRLDNYKNNLNEKTYKNMKFKIYNKISNYIEFVFNISNKNDTIYIISSFPSKLDYSKNRKLSPVIRFDNSKKEKGILKSSTTRRDGVIANFDIGVDILNRFGYKNQEMLGKKIDEVKKEDNINYIKNEYEKITSLSTLRSLVISVFVKLLEIFWILIALLIIFKKKFFLKEYNNKIINVLKEVIKFGTIFPLSFLTSAVINPISKTQILATIILLSIIYYIIGRRLFRGDDISQIAFYSILMIIAVIIDSIISTPLMKNSVLSYDPMIGARYYGIGNEFEGIIIGSAIIGLSILKQKKNIKNFIVNLILIIILITSAYPSMGANVGGAISGAIAFISFALMLNKIKIDYKKIIYIILITSFIVGIFAIADIYFELNSHLGNFVEQILLNGPIEILRVFTRKIAMNIRLGKTTIWSKLILVGILIIGIFRYKHEQIFIEIKEKYKYIYIGIISTLIGTIVTLLVNDSGIIAAATSFIYLFTILIILIYQLLYKKKEN